MPQSETNKARQKNGLEARTEPRSIRLTADELKYFEAQAAQDRRSVAWLIQSIVEAFHGSFAVRAAVKDYFRK